MPRTREQSSDRDADERQMAGSSSNRSMEMDVLQRMSRNRDSVLSPDASRQERAIQEFLNAPAYRDLLAQREQATQEFLNSPAYLDLLAQREQAIQEFLNSPAYWDLLRQNPQVLEYHAVHQDFKKRREVEFKRYIIMEGAKQRFYESSACRDLLARREQEFTESSVYQDLQNQRAREIRAYGNSPNYQNFRNQLAVVAERISIGQPGISSHYRTSQSALEQAFRLTPTGRTLENRIDQEKQAFMNTIDKAQSSQAMEIFSASSEGQSFVEQLRSEFDDPHSYQVIQDQQMPAFLSSDAGRGFVTQQEQINQKFGASISRLQEGIKETINSLDASEALRQAEMNFMNSDKYRAPEIAIKKFMLRRTIHDRIKQIGKEEHQAETNRMAQDLIKSRMGLARDVTKAFSEIGRSYSTRLNRINENDPNYDKMAMNAFVDFEAKRREALAKIEGRPEEVWEPLPDNDTWEPSEEDVLQMIEEALNSGLSIR